MPPFSNHKTTTFKRLWPLFGLWQDEKIDVGAHLIRLIVLYEDLRIEFHAFYASHLGELAQNDMIYRRLYSCAGSTRRSSRSRVRSIN